MKARIEVEGRGEKRRVGRREEGSENFADEVRRAEGMGRRQEEFGKKNEGENCMETKRRETGKIIEIKEVSGRQK